MMLTVKRSRVASYLDQRVAPPPQDPYLSPLLQKETFVQPGRPYYRQAPGYLRPSTVCLPVRPGHGVLPPVPHGDARVI